MPSAAPPLVPDVILGMSGRCVEDMTEEKRMRSIAQVLIVGTVCLFSTQALAQGTPGQTRPPDASVQQLRRDLEIMKEQMRQMQEKIQQQEEAIEKLSTPPAPPVAPPIAAPVSAPPAAGDREQLKQEVREEVMRDLQPKLAAATKTFPSQFNPAAALIIDTDFSYRQHEGTILTCVLLNSTSPPRSIPLRVATLSSPGRQIMASQSKRPPSLPPRCPII